MNKKMRIVLIVLFSAIVFTIICFIGFVWLNKKNKSFQEERYQQELLLQQEQMKISLNEINCINSESNFRGHLLLDAPLEGYSASEQNLLVTSDESQNIEDTYACSIYNGSNCITHISLKTEGANLYGIEVGDDVLKGKSLLEEKSYLIEEEKVDVIKCKKGNITIRFYFTADETIKEIAVAVVDPMVEQIDY